MESSGEAFEHSGSSPWDTQNQNQNQIMSGTQTKTKFCRAFFKTKNQIGLGTKPKPIGLGTKPKPKPKRGLWQRDNRGCLHGDSHRPGYWICQRPWCQTVHPVDSDICTVCRDNESGQPSGLCEEYKCTETDMRQAGSYFHKGPPLQVGCHRSGRPTERYGDDY